MKLRTMLEMIEGVLERKHCVPEALAIVKYGGQLYPVHDLHGELVSDEDDDAKLMVSLGQEVDEHGKVTGWGPSNASYLCQRLRALMTNYSDISLQFKEDETHVITIGDCSFSGKHGVLLIDLDME